MGHPRIDWHLTKQRGLVAVWQVRGPSCSESTVAHAVRSMREMHDGVYLSGHAAPTDWQTWKAATLSTPTTVLGDWSGASFLGMRERADRQPTTVRRPGSGGVQVIGPQEGRLGSLRIRRSTTLAVDTVMVDGIPCTSVARTLLDLIPAQSYERSDRMVRDILRLKLATIAELRALIAVHRGARGVARIRTLVDEYAPLPKLRTRSDAEILAVAILRAAGIELPRVNTWIAGGEADLAWVRPKAILELDGPQYHQFPTVDARKEARWRAAGWTVDRLPTDSVYDRPHLLIELAAALSTRSPAR